MFNARKLGAIIAKFDKKLYDFEKKKQMIEDVRSKDNEKLKANEKNSKDREINSICINETFDKSQVEIKKGDAEKNDRDGKSVDRTFLNNEQNDNLLKDASEISRQTLASEGNNFINIDSMISTAIVDNLGNSENILNDPILKSSLVNRNASDEKKKYMIETETLCNPSPTSKLDQSSFNDIVDEKYYETEKTSELIPIHMNPKIPTQDQLAITSVNKGLKKSEISGKDLVINCNYQEENYYLQATFISSDKKLDETEVITSNEAKLTPIHARKFYSQTNFEETKQPESTQSAERINNGLALNVPLEKKSPVKDRKKHHIKQPIKDKEKKRDFSKNSEKSIEKNQTYKKEKTPTNIKNEAKYKNTIKNLTKVAGTVEAKEKPLEIQNTDNNNTLGDNLAVDNTIIFNIISSKPEDISETHSPISKFNQISNWGDNTVMTKHDEYPMDWDPSKIEENIENHNFDSEKDIYNEFLYETVSHIDSLQSLLRNQMKNIIYNMKDRKKEIENGKVDKKKLILENLSRINDSTLLRDDKIRNVKSIIDENFENKNSNLLQDKLQKEFHTNDLTNMMEERLLNKIRVKEVEKENDLAMMIKGFQNNFRKNDFNKEAATENLDEKVNTKEISSINHNIFDKFQHSSREIKNNHDNSNQDVEQFDLVDNINNGDYLKDQTFQANIDQNININDSSKFTYTNMTRGDSNNSVNKSKSKKQLLVYGYGENPLEYEEKIRKITKLREKRLKDFDIKTKSNMPEIYTKEKTSLVNDRNKTRRIRSSNIYFDDNMEAIENPTRKAEEMNNLIQESNIYSGRENTMISERSNIESNRIQTVRSKSQFPNHVQQKMIKPQPIKSQKLEIKRNLKDIAPIKTTKKDTDYSRDIIKKEAGSKTPKYVVSYNKLSNKKIIKSAIKKVCLAAEPHRAIREQILEIIENCPFSNFLILFKGNYGRFDLRAVYTFNPITNKTELLTCLSPSPSILESNMIQVFYKYDLIQKEFKILPDIKEIAMIVDAVALSNIR